MECTILYAERKVSTWRHSWYKKIERKSLVTLQKSIPLLSARVLAPIEAVKVKSNTLVSLVTIKVVLESERITTKWLFIIGICTSYLRHIIPTIWIILLPLSTPPLYYMGLKQDKIVTRTFLFKRRITGKIGEQQRRGEESRKKSIIDQSFGWLSKLINPTIWKKTFMHFSLDNHRFASGIQFDWGRAKWNFFHQIIDCSWLKTLKKPMENQQTVGQRVQTILPFSDAFYALSLA